ncbi:MAG: 16S rRNA processing protein RimM, partial [Dehalococcoidia bacterium]
IKGEVKFQYYNNEKEVFNQYTAFSFKNENNRWIKLKPTCKRPYKGCFFIKFKGYDDLENASSLINKELFVKEEDLLPLGDNEYYEYQLIGLTVSGRNGVNLGNVAEIMHTYAQDLIVVRGEKETIIPMNENYILSIDITRQSITVIEPEI